LKTKKNEKLSEKFYYILERIKQMKNAYFIKADE
jgi:hypothetical protein